MSGATRIMGKGGGISTWKLFCDGASRGNPGAAGAGAILYDPAGKPVVESRRYLGTATNNEAEYGARIMGLESAVENGVREIEVFLDSELVVRQMNGAYRVKSQNLKPLFFRARKLLNGF